MEPAIQFLDENASYWWQYWFLAEGYAFFNKAHELNRYREVDKLLRAAVIRFPKEGLLYKRICLFWERRAEFGLAVEYCRIAYDRHLQDDTKNGFPRRLKRLEKKVK